MVRIRPSNRRLVKAATNRRSRSDSHRRWRRRPLSQLGGDRLYRSVEAGENGFHCVERNPTGGLPVAATQGARPLVRLEVSARIARRHAEGLRHTSPVVDDARIRLEPIAARLHHEWSPWPRPARAIIARVSSGPTDHTASATFGKSLDEVEMP